MNPTPSSPKAPNRTSEALNRMMLDKVTEGKFIVKVSKHELECIAYKYACMENAVRKVLADSESKDGGWGPDITLRQELQRALSFDPISQDA